MKKLYRLDMKAFMKTLYLSITPILILIYFTMIMTDGMSVSQGMGVPANVDIGSFVNYIGSMLGRYGLAAFSYFLFATYEFFIKVKDRSTEEVIASHCGGKKRVTLSRMLVMLTVALIFSAISGTFIVTLHMAKIPFESGMVWNTVLAIVLYITGPSLIGISLGMMFSFLMGRLPFYVCGLILSFLISPFSTDIMLALGFFISNTISASVSGVVLSLTELITGLRPIYNKIVNITFGQGLEPYRWQLVMFWILLPGFFVMLKCMKKIKKKQIAQLSVVGILCVFSLYGAMTPGSHWQRNKNATIADIVKLDSFYYTSEISDMISHSKDEAPLFSIKSYDIKLSAFKELSGSVEMELDGTELSEYCFTLYHGFNVRSVTGEGGEKLSFEREQDYLNVKNDTGKPLTRITVSYSGHHNFLYSTAQGIYLPGYLCYYPVEGKYPMYLAQAHSLNYRIMPQTDREFRVKISALCDIKTNLKKDESGEFFGRARSLSIVGGLFREYETGDVSNIAPIFSGDMDILSTLEDTANSFYDQTGIRVNIPKIKTIIHAPSVELPVPETETKCVILEDTLLLPEVYHYKSPASPMVMEMVLRDMPQVKKDTIIYSTYLRMAQSVIDGEKSAKGYFVQQFGVKKLTGFKKVPSMTDEQNAAREIDYYIYEALIKNGVKNTFMQMREYLGDDKSTVSELDFAKGMSKG